MIFPAWSPESVRVREQWAAAHPPMPRVRWGMSEITIPRIWFVAMWIWVLYGLGSLVFFFKISAAPDWPGFFASYAVSWVCSVISWWFGLHMTKTKWRSTTRRQWAMTLALPFMWMGIVLMGITIGWVMLGMVAACIGLTLLRVQACGVSVPSLFARIRRLLFPREQPVTVWVEY